MFRSTKKKRKVLQSKRQFRTNKEEEDDEEENEEGIRNDKMTVDDDDDDDVDSSNKAPPRNSKTDDNDDDDDEDDIRPVIIRRRPTTKDKKKITKIKRSTSSSTASGGVGSGSGFIIRSFDMEVVDDEEEENDDNDSDKHRRRRSNNKKHKKDKKNNRKGGFGFGGGISMPSRSSDDDDEEEDKEVEEGRDNTESHEPMDSTTTTTTYGKDALEQLKAEQRLRPPPKDDENNLPNASIQLAPLGGQVVKTSVDGAPSSSNQPPAAAAAADATSSSMTAALPSYIPLQNGGGGGDYESSEILTGDDALQFHKQHGGGILHEKNRTTTIRMDIDDDDHDNNKMTADHEHFQSMADDSTDWEDQIARRAGLLPQQQQQNQSLKSTLKLDTSSTSDHMRGLSSSSRITSTTTTTTANTLGDKKKKKKNIPSLDNLKQQLQMTISKLQHQYDDIETATMRRQTELLTTQTDLKRHQQSLIDSGKACDDYQQLRLVITSYVGAIRELQSKIQPICDTLVQLLITQLKLRLERTTQWHDDVISILHDSSLLDRVLGRQPPNLDQNTTTSTTTTMDEFGRDVQSQYVRQREKRCWQRIELQRQYQQQQQQSLNSNSSDSQLVDHTSNGHALDKSRHRRRHSPLDAIFWVVEEDEARDWKDRYLALQEAIRVTVHELEEEYISLSKMLQIFREWRQSRPEEYHQCYANLSVADLSSVLVLVELCRSSWMCQMTALYDEEDGDPLLDNKEDDGNTNAQERSSSNSNDNNSSPTSTTVVFHGILELEMFLKEDQTATGREHNDDQGTVGRTLEKSILPFLFQIFEHPQSLLFPSRSSQLLSHLVSYVIRHFQKKNEGRNDSSSSSNEHIGILMQLEQAVQGMLKTTLESLCMPIVKTGTDNNNIISTANIPLEQVSFVVSYAQGPHVDYVKHVLMTILQHWVPILQLLSTSSLSSSQQNGTGDGSGSVENFMGLVFDFVSSKFLYLISSLDNRPVASSMFQCIWDILRYQYQEILSAPQYFLQTAPIRAAAAAYGLQGL